MENLYLRAILCKTLWDFQLLLKQSWKKENISVNGLLTDESLLLPMVLKSNWNKLESIQIC